MATTVCTKQFCIQVRTQHIFYKSPTVQNREARNQLPSITIQNSPQNVLLQLLIAEASIYKPQLALTVYIIVDFFDGAKDKLTLPRRRGGEHPQHRAPSLFGAHRRRSATRNGHFFSLPAVTWLRGAIPSRDDGHGDGVHVEIGGFEGRH